MTELKPCPFCCGEAEHYEDGYMQHYVVCTRRGCYARSFGFESESEAAEAWNTRAERTCKNLKQRGYNYMECSACGETSYQGDRQFNYCPNCGAKVVER